MEPMMGEDMEYDDAFASAIADAFPMEEWDEGRIAALKEAIRLCVKKDTAGDSKEKPAPKKGIDLALIMGGPPKGKK